MFIKKIKNIFYLPYKATVNFINHDGVEHAGYMAFMNILSLFPFLVFLVSLAGFIGQKGYGIEFINLILDNLPNEFTNALKPRIIEILSGPPQSLLTMSIFGAIWTASSSVEGIRTILNRIYHVSSPPAYIFRRLSSIIQFLSLTIIIMLVMLMLFVWPIIYQKILILLKIKSLDLNFLAHHLPLPIFASYKRDITLMVILFLLVSISYWFLPNIKISYKSVIPGSVLVVFAWFMTATVAGSFIHSYEQVSIIYGSLGGIIISMIFFFIINTIYIYGAEINYLLRIA